MTDAGTLLRSLIVRPFSRAQERTSALLGTPSDRATLPVLDLPVSPAAVAAPLVRRSLPWRPASAPALSSWSAYPSSFSTGLRSATAIAGDRHVGVRGPIDDAAAGDPRAPRSPRGPARRGSPAPHSQGNPPVPGRGDAQDEVRDRQRHRNHPSRASGKESPGYSADDEGNQKRCPVHNAHGTGPIGARDARRHHHATSSESGKKPTTA